MILSKSGCFSRNWDSNDYTYEPVLGKNTLMVLLKAMSTSNDSVNLTICSPSSS